MQQISELISESVDKLIEMQDITGGGNRPKHPTMVIFLGNHLMEGMKVIKKTLDLNWEKYAKNIPYIHVTLDDADQFKGKYIFEEKEREENGVGVIDEALIQMLASPETVFPNKMKVKFEFLLSSEEEDWEKYYRFLNCIEKNSGFVALKTLYLLIKQSTSEEKKHAKQVVTGIINIQKSVGIAGMSAIYLLSNYLKNGQLLIGKSEKLNYRLIANIILLGGTSEFMTSIYGTGLYKTASYTLVEKPVTEIAIATLTNILIEMKEKLTAEIQSDSVDKFTKRLRLLPNGNPFLLNVFTNKIQSKLPTASDILLLAGREQSMKNMSGVKNIQQLSQMTLGISDLFFDRYFYDFIEDWLKENGKKIAQQLVNDWIDSIDYLDIIRYFKNPEVQSAIMPTIGTEKKEKDNYSVIIYHSIMDQIKSRYFEEIEKSIKMLMDEAYNAAIYFEKMYNLLVQEAENENIGGDETRLNIDVFYKKEVEKNILQHYEQWKKNMFCITQKKEDVLEHVSKIFSELVTSDKIYGYSFEDELEIRLNEGKDVTKNLIINNELDTNIDNYLRLHLHQDPGIPITFYLINKEAVYAKELIDHHVDISVFDLNRKDCIEKMKIYSIEKPEFINYMVGD